MVIAVLGVALICVSRLPHVPLCAIRSFTGHDCPTCGTTRSLWNIFHGNFAAAWRFNPIGFVVTAVLARRVLVLLAMLYASYRAAKPSALSGRILHFRTLVEHRVFDYALLSAAFAGGMWKMFSSL